MLTGKGPFLADETETEEEFFARVYPKGILNDPGVPFRGITVRH